jgi:exopolysaccharide production protein ExoQ
VPRNDDVAANLLLAGEWLFLLFVLTVASYALSLQPVVQSLAWYLIYLLALGLFVLRYGAFLTGLWVALPLLLWPLLAGLSFVWSDAPGQTLRSAVQLAMTVLISIYLGARFSLFDLARALFLVLAVTALLSLAAIAAQFAFAYDNNGVARGIFPHKNVLGGRMVLLLICCLLLFGIGWHRFAMIVMAGIALVLTALSESGTAIVMAFGLCALAPALLSRHAAAPLRLMAYIGGLMLAAMAAWAVLALDLDPMGIALDALGKERTLTGRSVLWDFASAQVEARPWLGNGFDAFWNGGDGSQGRYVQYVLRQDVKNFHNSYLDIAVQLGFVGLALAIVYLLAFAGRAFALLRRERGSLAALPAFFAVFVVAYSVSEYAIFRQHALIQILLGALYVSAALALPAPLPGPSRRQASPASRAET